MLFLKPIIKTLIISTVLFFILVYLGMKYHWVVYLQNKPTNVELAIPEQPFVISKFESIKIEDDLEKIQPSLIQEHGTSALLVNMDKGQIKKSCQQLFRKMAMNNDQIEIAVGDCVVSNFKTSDNNPLQSTQNRQIQTQRRNAEQQCQQMIAKTYYNSDIEKQLLIGICISSKLNH